uniref:SAM domain-containing protein n=1 Tax=Anolis carolinensis TaxID=28377 RepID=A0A803TXC5_ANOCA
QESTLSDDSTPPSSSPKTLSTAPPEAKYSYPYHTLSQSSDEFLDEPLSTASTWSSQKVGQWLESLNLEQYMAEFAAQEVDGQQLLLLDGTKLKVRQEQGSGEISMLSTDHCCGCVPSSCLPYRDLKIKPIKGASGAENV